MFNQDNSYPIKNLPWLLILSYELTIIFTNWFLLRPINLLGIDTNGGVFLLPFAYSLLTVTAAVYGYKYAQKIIGLGLLLNCGFIGYGLLLACLPYPEFSANSVIFNKLLLSNLQTFFIFLLAYPIPQYIIIYLYEKLPLNRNKPWLFYISLVISTLSGTILYIMITKAIRIIEF